MMTSSLLLLLLLSMYAVRIDSVVDRRSRKMAAENKTEDSWSRSGVVVPKYKSSLRFDVVYNLVPVRRFTKENLFRILYSDSQGDLVCGNALRMTYSASCNEETLSEGRGYTCELVYIFIDQYTGHHTINRSQVLLEKLTGFEESYIRSEHVLWRIRVGHIDEMIKLYSYFADENESVNLTHLRKIATNKKISKHVQLRIDNSGEYRSPDASSTRPSSGHYPERRVEQEAAEMHQLSVEIWSNTVLLTHRCFDLVDGGRMIFEEFLLKYDITSFLDFLRITRQIIILENDGGFQLETTSENTDFTEMNQKRRFDYSTLAKLSAISEKLSGISKQKKRGKRKKQHDERVEPKSLKTFDENNAQCSNEDDVQSNASLFEQLTELFDGKFEN